MADTESRGKSGGIALIVQAGDFERVHYALALAAAAVAVNRPAVLFFTGAAIRALVRDPDGWGGWAALPADAGNNGARSAGVHHAESGAERDAILKERGIGDFETLLAACAQLGAKFIVCEMGLRAYGIDAATLRSDVPHEVAGIVTLYEHADGMPIVAL